MIVDRLKRRLESYRRRQTECVPRFDQSFSGACEQQGLETTALQRRYLEGKAKRAAKKGERAERRQPDLQQHPHSLTSNLHSSVHVQQKFLKRSAEEAIGGGSSGGLSPPGKTSRGAPAAESLTKFSVEIVQQLEFTTSAADSQPQQISTNVTVKALTNASVKSEGGTPLLECKREQPDPDFPDLDQCAAALEKDAAANFPVFTDFIGDEADAFKDLISDINSDFTFMNDFDFEDKYADTLSGDHNKLLLNNGQLKTEDLPPIHQNAGMENSVAPSGPGRGLPGRPPGYGGGELSPAAQTLKQMAEQHQHKQMGLGPRAARSPYELHDYLSTPQAAFRKQDPVKQEVIFPGSYKPYSPYGSPGSAGHGSPGYLPRGSFGGPSPPRPPSGPPPQQPPSGSNLLINQAQHLHISHPSHAIQVSAGQHMHLSGELQGNVSVAAQQGMYFGQTNASHQGAPSPHHQAPSGGGEYTVSQSQTINFTQQSLRQRQQQQQQQQQAQTANSSPMSNNGSPMGQQSNVQNNSAPNGPTLGQSNPGMGNMSNMGMSNNMVQNNPNMVSGLGNIVNNMSSMNPMSMSREQHAKLMQQQQMMRAQQAMHQGQQGHLRPPPPDYKSSQNPLGGAPQPRYTQPGIRRATHQPMPPSGPMMRPGGVVYSGETSRYAAPAGNTSHPVWRHHLAMQQQQQAAINFQRHPSNMANFTHHQHQGGFPMGATSNTLQHQIQQQQLLRSQQQIISQSHHQQQQIPNHLMAQQNQGISMQGQSQNININQSQSLSLHQGNPGMNAQGSAGPQSNNQTVNPQQVSTGVVSQFPSIQNTGVNNSSSGFPGQPPDFNLDFLENMPSGDSNNFMAQDLLIDNEYYLQDINF